MDLLKAFDSLNHELVVAKLKCYGLHQNVLECFKSCIANHHQCCKIIPTGFGKKL